MTKPTPPPKATQKATLMLSSKITEFRQLKSTEARATVSSGMNIVSTPSYPNFTSIGEFMVEDNLHPVVFNILRSEEVVLNGIVEVKWRVLFTAYSKYANAFVKHRIALPSKEAYLFELGDKEIMVSGILESVQ